MTGGATPSEPKVGNTRIVFIGDTVGKPGLRVTCAAIEWLRCEMRADGIIVNAENAADGSGLRCKDYRRLIEAGVDGITLGDHVYRKREIMEVLESETNIVRPANLPASAPGRPSTVLKLSNGVQVGLVCALGRVFMKPVDCPFSAVDNELREFDDSVQVRLVDFHAEATSDMQLMGRFVDGRASAVLGTHTHVATADEKILPGGTAFQCDVGMTGPFESILGRRIEAVMEATLRSLPTPFQVATGDVRLNASWFDVQTDTGLCTAIARIDEPEATFTKYGNERTEARKIL